MAIDEDKLSNLLGRFVTDLGAAMHAGNAVIGDRRSACGPGERNILGEATLRAPQGPAPG